MSDNSNLTRHDVDKLLTDPSPETRAMTAQKVGMYHSSEQLGPAEVKLAEEIFRVMVQDAEVRVRKALSESLKDNPEIPHDVALSLANDVAEVSVPMLESSAVLTDDDLIEIVRTTSPSHQSAIARRDIVSENVAESLIQTHHEDVVATLVGNDGAQLSERSLSNVLDEFGENQEISAKMTRRRQLPITVSERLVTMVSESLRDYLVTHHAISPDLSSDLLLQSRERATVGLLDAKSDMLDVYDLVEQLHDHGRLTPMLIMRALCMGDMNFFEASLARRAGIPHTNVYTLIHDQGGLGLKSLFTACRIPEAMLELACTAITVAEETDYDGRDNDQERFRQKMIERVLTQFEGGMDATNFDYLISKLSSDHRRKRSAVA